MPGTRKAPSATSGKSDAETTKQPATPIPTAPARPTTAMATSARSLEGRSERAAVKLVERVRAQPHRQEEGRERRPEPVEVHRRRRSGPSAT